MKLFYWLSSVLLSVFGCKCPLILWRIQLIPHDNASSDPSLGSLNLKTGTSGAEQNLTRDQSHRVTKLQTAYVL